MNIPKQNRRQTHTHEPTKSKTHKNHLNNFCAKLFFFKRARKKTTLKSKMLKYRSHAKYKLINLRNIQYNSNFWMQGQGTRME